MVKRLNEGACERSYIMLIKESRDCSWQELRSKSVEDSDGFLTDYTLYYDADIDSYMCIFGDKEVYNPDNTEPDWEGDDRLQADEWFDSYDTDYEDDLDWDDEDGLDNPYDESLTESNRGQSFVDASGVMGNVGETWTVADLRNYWEEEKDYDPELQDYDSFDSWVIDTIDLMEPIEDTIEPEEDWYIDTSGIVGDFGEAWTVSQLRDYWNAESEYDPVLQGYDSFDSWLSDTISQMEPVQESLTESNVTDYKVGDVITFDGNIYGVTPRIGKGTIVSIGKGLAGHGDPNPGRVFKIKGENGKIFSIDENQIVTESIHDDFDDEYGNTVSNELPPDVDIFLMDFAQVYGGIDYNNIVDLGAVWELLPEETTDAIYQTINQIEEACDDTGLDCYETAQEYGDVRDDCERLIQLVKGHEKF